MFINKWVPSALVLPDSMFAVSLEWMSWQMQKQRFVEGSYAQWSHVKCANGDMNWAIQMHILVRKTIKNNGILLDFSLQMNNLPPWECEMWKKGPAFSLKEMSFRGTATLEVTFNCKQFVRLWEEEQSLQKRNWLRYKKNLWQIQSGEKCTSQQGRKRWLTTIWQETAPGRSHIKH